MSPVAWVLKHPVKAACVLLVALALIAVGLRLWNSGRKDAAIAEANATVASGQVKAGQDAQRVVVDIYNRAEQIDAQTRENRDDILRAEGSDQAIPAAVVAAGRHALCMRAAYRSEPACQQLRDAHP